MDREAAKIRKMTKVAEARGKRVKSKVNMNQEDAVAEYTLAQLASVDASVATSMSSLRKVLPEGRAAAKAARLKVENEKKAKAEVNAAANAEKAIAKMNKEEQGHIGSMNMPQKKVN